MKAYSYISALILILASAIFVPFAYAQENAKNTDCAECKAQAKKATQESEKLVEKAQKDVSDVVEQVKKTAQPIGTKTMRDDDVIWDDDVARNKNGKILEMTQHDAVKYCEKERKRLPTLREQALLSQSMGAKGFKETRLVDIKASDQRVSVEINQMSNDGYDVVFKKNAAGEIVVNFYFNSSGYQKPTGDLGEFYFWSSSAHPVNSATACGLDGRNGKVYCDYRDNYVYGAVRCVRNR